VFVIKLLDGTESTVVDAGFINSKMELLANVEKPKGRTLDFGTLYQGIGEAIYDENDKLVIADYIGIFKIL